MRDQPRTRIRYGMAVSLEEYSSRNINKVRALQAEMFTSGGYIGYFDAWDKTLRAFVFTDPGTRDKALKEARRIGFGSAGRIDGEIFVSNADLERTHLQHMHSKDQFYREYYR